MSNLLGLKCPQCGNEDRLSIIGSTWLEVTAQGVDATDSDHEFDSDSPARCDACKHRGTVGDFEPDEGDDE